MTLSCLRILREGLPFTVVADVVAADVAAIPDLPAAILKTEALRAALADASGRFVVVAKVEQIPEK